MLSTKRFPINRTGFLLKGSHHSKTCSKPQGLIEQTGTREFSRKHAAHGLAAIQIFPISAGLIPVRLEHGGADGVLILFFDLLARYDDQALGK
jgi:hypothetical protein